MTYSHLLKDALCWISVFSLVAAVGTAGCGNTGEDETGNLPPPGGAGPGPTPPPPEKSDIKTGPCDEEEGVEFKCVVVIKQANDIISCFYGIQYCAFGEWTQCLEEGTDPPVR